jgi:hypothetical protein
MNQHIISKVKVPEITYNTSILKVVVAIDDTNQVKMTDDKEPANTKIVAATPAFIIAESAVEADIVQCVVCESDSNVNKSPINEATEQPNIHTIISPTLDCRIQSANLIYNKLTIDNTDYTMKSYSEILEEYDNPSRKDINKRSFLNWIYHDNGIGPKHVKEPTFYRDGLKDPKGRELGRSNHGKNTIPMDH